MSASVLSPQEVRQLREQGFLVFERLLDPERLAHYRPLFDALVERGRGLETPIPHFALELDGEEKPIPGMLHKVQGVCQVEPRLLELAGEPALLDRVEALLGPDIDVFGTKFFPKLPGGGTSTHWHQDNFYFATVSEQVLSCGIYLEDADRDNGCLRVVPGSHLKGLVEHQRDPRTHGSWCQVEEKRALDLPVPAGTAVLFSANLLHGAKDNLHSRRTRYSTAWHYIPGALHLERFPRGVYEDRHAVRGR